MVQVPKSLESLEIFESFRAQLKVSFYMENWRWSIWSVKNNFISREEATNRKFLVWLSYALSTSPLFQYG